MKEIKKLNLKKHCFIFSVILTSFISTSTQAQIFAGYDQFCGIPLIVTPNQQTASAARDQFGRPVIYVDPSAMSNWSHSRVFALAHECAHHKDYGLEIHRGGQQESRSCRLTVGLQEHFWIYGHYQI